MVAIAPVIENVGIDEICIDLTKFNDAVAKARPSRHSEQSKAAFRP